MTWGHLLLDWDHWVCSYFAQFLYNLTFWICKGIEREELKWWQCEEYCSGGCHLMAAQVILPYRIGKLERILMIKEKGMVDLRCLSTSSCECFSPWTCSFLVSVRCFLYYISYCQYQISVFLSIPVSGRPSHPFWN